MSGFTADDFAANGDTAFADGHPESPCDGPIVEGEVVVEESLGATIRGEDIATSANAYIHFPEHGHDVDEGDDDEEPECIDFQEHDITPDPPKSGIELRGDPVLMRGEVVGSDPVTGGDVWIEDP